MFCWYNMKLERDNTPNVACPKSFVCMIIEYDVKLKKASSKMSNEHKYYNSVICWDALFYQQF